MYRKYVKRILDLILSLIALIILSPLMIILLLVGLLVFSGKPLFIQKRPGKIDSKTGKEKIFNYIKLKTMNDYRDEQGVLLSDEQRLNLYGKFIRSTSLDEIFSLINIIKGDMSIVGPRPLLVEYLSLYTPEQRRRHEVLPGLTGLAQVNGRNSIPFEKRFILDIEYIDNLCFKTDLRILLLTISTVFHRKGIHSESHATTEKFKGTKNKKEYESTFGE